MISEGQTCYVQGSGAKPYECKCIRGVFSCSCPAWRNQSAPISQRTCKHLRKLLGTEAEDARVGGFALARQARAAAEAEAAEAPAPVAHAVKAEPPVLLAHKFDEADGVDPTGWWCSEKLDGVRAWWDGAKFVSRLGNVFAAPDLFKAGLPSFPLDGELWMGRGKFAQTVSVVRSDNAGVRWREVRYVVFDAPAHGGTFEERQAFLAASLGSAAYARVLEQAPLASAALLKPLLDAIVAQGGEGLMLRKPGSRYEPGRSWTLLKVKPFRDAEGRIVGHEAGKGKHKGRLGALVVRAADGHEFNVGTGFSDAERESPPPVGAVITYRYTELTAGGVPRFPRFVAVRNYE